MEEKLLELFRLANELNDNQDKVYAQIDYYADNNKKLTISIISKNTYNYIDKCSVMLVQDSISKLDAILKLFEKYIGGSSNE